MSAGDGLAVGVKGYESGKSLGKDIGEGNLLAAGKDVWDIGGLAKDVSAFVGGHSGAALGDPLEALIEAGLSFLIDLVAPLKQALDLVTGDPDGLNAKADQWNEVGASLRELGPAVGQDAARTQGSWAGAAGDAFRAKIAAFEHGVASVAGQADHVADVLRVSATLMDGAQGLIKSIIASWVEYAILTEAAAAASALFTFGASEAAGQAAVAGEAAMACGQGAETVGQTSSMLERVASMIRHVEGEFSTLAQAVQEQATALRQAEGALRSASDVFAQTGRNAARKALDEGISKAVKNAGIDTAIGVGDDTIKGGRTGNRDGHESQRRIDGDLTLGGS
ncbi:MAG TPA: hypothetical protein VIG48_06720 [Jatrophihabitans sp.]|jgi:uncharacterized protein YukE